MSGASTTVARWRADPVLFAQQVLGIDPWIDEHGRDSQATVDHETAAIVDGARR